MLHDPLITVGGNRKLAAAFVAESLCRKSRYRRR
jgi:hypothetical protein